MEKMTKNPSSYTYLIDISYIGTDFNGFQSQSDGNGIQDHLEKAISILLRKKVKVKGASRTDRGVHAFSQKAIFVLDEVLDTFRFLRSVNAILTKGICIKSVIEVEANFDPIKRAQAKVYRYSIWFGHCYNPFISPFVWEIPRTADKEVFETELKLFEGTHDFTSFCNTDSSAKTRTRTILKTHVECYENSCDLWILGEGFLKQMIRIIAGTLVERSLDKKEIPTIAELLMLKDRVLSGQTAPGKALSLVEIFYNDPPEFFSYIEEKKKKAFFYR